MVRWSGLGRFGVMGQRCGTGVSGGAGRGLGRAGRWGAFQRVKVPLLWVTPRLVRRVRLTAAALVVSQRWLAATPR